jgi:hypothetical protein
MHGTSGVSVPRRLGRRVFIEGDAKLPCLSPLNAVVVTITLGDLVFLVLRLARSVPLLRRGLVPVENRLLRRGSLAATRWAHFNYNDKKA